LAYWRAATALPFCITDGKMEWNQGEYITNTT